MRSREDLAYIAGLLDGEGSASIVKHKNKHTRGWSYQPCLSIGNTYKPVLDWVQEILNVGSVKGKDYAGRPKNHKLGYYWQLYDMSGIAWIITQLLPYLKIKKEQALLLRDFCWIRRTALESWTPKRDSRGRFIKSKCPYSNEEHNIYEELRSMNGRG